MPYTPNNFTLDEDTRRSIEAARVGGMGASSEFTQAPLAGPQYDYKLGERSFGYSPGQRTPTQLGSPLDVSQGLFRGAVGGVGRGLKSLVHAGQYLGNLAGSAGEAFGLPQNLNPEGNRSPESYGAYRLGQWIEDRAPQAFPPVTPQAPGEPPTFATRLGEAGGFMANMAVGGALGGPPGAMAAAAGETMAPSYETAKYLGADDQEATNRAAASGAFNAGLMGIGGPTQMLGRIFKEPARQIAEAGFYNTMRQIGAEGVKGTINMGAISGAATLGEQAIQQQPFDLGQAGMAALEAGPIGGVLGAGGVAARDMRLPSLESVSGAIKRSGAAAEGRIKAANSMPKMNIDPKLMGDYAKVGASIVTEGLENLGDFLKAKKAALGDKVSDEDLSRVHAFALSAYRQEQSKLPSLTSRTETTERVAGQVEAQNLPPEIANEVQAKGQGRETPQGQEGLLEPIAKEPAPGGTTTPPAQTPFQPSRAQRLPPPPKGNLPFTNALKAGEVSEGVDLPKMGPGKGEQLPLEIPSGEKGQKTDWQPPPDAVVDMQNKNKGKGILETLPTGTSESQLPVGGTDIAGQVMNAARSEQGPARTVLYTVGKRLRNAVAVDKTVAGSVAQRIKNFTRTYRGDKETIAEMTEPVQLKSITGQDVPNGYWTKKTDAIEGRAERTVGGLVGTADYPGLSPKARAAVLEFRRIYTDAIERARSLGARWMKDPATGTWFDVGNQVKSEGKVPRWRTDAERDIWFDKYDPDHRVLLDVVSKANNITVEDAQAKFDQIGASSGDRTVGAVEVMRAFKIFPEAIKSSKTGDLIWLIEPDPIRHVTSGVEKVARAAGFQSQFPKESFSELKDAALSSAKDRKNTEKVLDRANRAGQGAPLESDEWAGGLLESIGNTVPGAKAVGKAIKASDTVLKGAALTGSAVQQVVEPMGSIPAYTGSKNLAKGYGEAVTSPNKTNESLHEIGAINNKALDTRITSLDDAAKFVSTSLTTASGFTPVNQLNEAASGAAGQAFVRGMKENAKAGKPAEAATVDSLRRLKFTESQIRNLVRGKASKILENDVVQRIVTYTQGENQRALERPVWGESKIVGSFQPFLRYANLASDAVITGLQNVHNQMQRAQTMPNGPTRNAQIAASIKGLGRYLGGKQAAGAATVALASLYFGRTTKRDDENWAEYVGNNFLAGGVGAQTTSAYYRIRNASESGANPVVALGVGGNPTMNAFANFAKAWGKVREYKDTTGPEAAFKLLQQTVPGTRVSTGIMALAGMGESPDLNKAIRRVNELRKDLGFMEGGIESGYDPFRHDMKALIKALKSGDEDEALSLYANIVKSYNQPPPGAPASERIEASVRGRLALSGKGGAPLSPQERETFKKKLGEKDYALLEAYDKTLLAITSDNLGSAGEFYYKLGRLRGEYKASGKVEKPQDLQTAEGISAKIHQIQSLIDSTEDKAEIRKYQAWKYDALKYATKYLGLPKTGTERANLKQKIDEILKEKK